MSVEQFADVTVAIERPDQPDILFLIRDLDAYQTALYPGESAHLLGIEALCADDVHFFVARCHHSPVGCGALRCLPDAAAELKRMYVVPQARGFGVGRRLLTEIETHARRIGVRTLRLETGVRQHEALGLYRSAGFEVRGPFGDYGPDQLSVFMEKNLPDQPPPA
jgi:putative acetyltransferase